MPWVALCSLSFSVGQALAQLAFWLMGSVGCHILLLDVHLASNPQTSPEIEFLDGSRVTHMYPVSRLLVGLRRIPLGSSTSPMRNRLRVQAVACFGLHVGCHSPSSGIGSIGDLRGLLLVVVSCSFCPSGHLLSSGWQGNFSAEQCFPFLMHNSRPQVTISLAHSSALPGGLVSMARSRFG